MLIRYSPIAESQLNEIYSNSNIYDRHGHFTQYFINWNSEFHRYLNTNAIGKQQLSEKGLFKIGTIGMVEYQCFCATDTIVFEIVEFRFSKLPYSKQSQRNYTVVGDGGFGYKIIQSTFNHKRAILTPRRGFLTRFVFDSIIGFHHSSNDYNTVYAIGFTGNRVYSIFQNGDINLLPLSKDEYLSMKHEYYESVQNRRRLLHESRLKRIIRNAIRETVGL